MEILRLPRTSSRGVAAAPPVTAWLRPAPWSGHERERAVSLGDLLQRAAEGDEVAAGDFFDATCGVVQGLAVRILRDQAAAEDVVIEVYTQAWSLARTYDSRRGNPVGWLLTLARSRSIDALRARRREQGQEPLDAAGEQQSDQPSPEEATVAAERRRLVVAALAQLTAEQRAAIELAYFRGLSHTQIAARLNEPLGTVKTRIRQGMIRMREMLGHMAEARAGEGGE